MISHVVASYLTSDLCSAFIDLHFPEESERSRSDRCQSWLQRFERGERSFRDIVLLRQGGRAIWSFSVFSDGDQFGIQTPKHIAEIDLQPSEWTDSVHLLKARLSERLFHRAVLRFTTARLTTGLPAALQAIGFSKRSDRVEFRAELHDLPEGANSPLIWRALDEDSQTLVLSAQVLDRCSSMDPNWDVGQLAPSLINDGLADTEFSSSLEAVQIGYLKGDPVAFVFAQVERSTGWSRLTYMGLIPELRGQGLGKWVHRHGFDMMRRQGGRVYHGSTTDTNLPMLRTFLAQGCKECRRVQEWILTS
jgi:GNAT superfamily N-acetyltransferase